MYHLLKENHDSLKHLSLQNDPYRIGNNVTNRGKVTNWQNAREALANVSVIPFAKEISFLILDNPYFAREQDSFHIPYETYQDLYPKYENFLIQIDVIIEFFENSGFDVIEQGFDIKMPPTDCLDDFARNLDLLNKCINQCPYLKVENESISLKKTDIGSIWFEFAIAATGASVLLGNLAKLIDKCVKIKSHYLTTKQQKEELRKLTLGNDVIETMQQAYDEVTKSVVNKCIDELKQEIPDVELDNDGVSRVKFSIENLSQLMEKGMEIYASLDAPQEVKALFPTYDEMTLLPNPRKLLEDNSEE